MKNITLISSALLLGLTLMFSGCGSSAPTPPAVPATAVDVEKQGFLSIDSCVEQGAFQDCYLENYMCGSDGCYKQFDAGVFGPVQVVLYLHKEGHTYNIDTSRINIADVDGGINRNEVTIVGKYDEASNTIFATDFKAPPPPKKSFFKGCL